MPPTPVHTTERAARMETSVHGHCPETQGLSRGWHRLSFGCPGCRGPSLQHAGRRAVEGAGPSPPKPLRWGDLACSGLAGGGGASGAVPAGRD